MDDDAARRVAGTRRASAGEGGVLAAFADLAAAGAAGADPVELTTRL